jgi:hypothetical protein
MDIGTCQRVQFIYQRESTLRQIDQESFLGIQRVRLKLLCAGDGGCVVPWLSGNSGEMGSVLRSIPLNDPLQRWPKKRGMP